MYKVLSIKYFLIFFILYTTFYILYTNVPYAHGQEIRSFTISPPTVQLSVEPGETIEGVLKFSNNSSETLTFLASVHDFTVRDEFGTPSLAPSGSLAKKFKASNWISVNAPLFILNPSEQQELTYSLKVPTDATAGGHYASVVYAPTHLENSEKTGALVETKIGTLFYIQVKGDIKEKAILTSFFANQLQEFGPIKISSSIRNLGDFHIQPVGTITVSDMLNNKEIQNISQYNIFPQASRNFENQFGKKLMFGKFKAEFQARYGVNNDKILTGTLYFWIIPWRIITLVTLILIALVLGLIYLLKRRVAKNQPTTNDVTSSSQGRE